MCFYVKTDYMNYVSKKMYPLSICGIYAYYHGKK
jgi:hypothetical protein